MSFLNKFILALVLVVIAAMIIPTNNPNNFVLARHGSIIADNCNDIDDKLEVIVKWNKHQVKGYTGYAVAIEAGRCPVYRFTSRVNGTTGLYNKIKTDVEEHLHNNNVTFDMIKVRPGQNIDGQGNFTI